MSAMLAFASAQAQERQRANPSTDAAKAAHVIRSCVRTKWNVSGTRSAEASIVKLRLKFNRDGRLTASPEVINPETHAGFTELAQSAVRAVIACEPYPLSPKAYDIWKDVILTFDARDMF
jgi:hypothetical protein